MKKIIILLCIAALFGACEKEGGSITEPLKFSAWNTELDSATLAQKELEAYSDDAEWVILRGVAYLNGDGSSVQFSQGEGDSLVAYYLTGGVVSYILTGEDVYQYFPQIMRMIVQPADATIATHWDIVRSRLAAAGYCKIFYDSDMGKFYIRDNNQKKVIE